MDFSLRCRANTVFSAGRECPRLPVDVPKRIGASVHRAWRMSRRFLAVAGGIAAISLACLSVAVPGKMILPGALLGGLHPATLELLVGAVAKAVCAALRRGSRQSERQCCLVLDLFERDAGADVGNVR